MSGLDLVILRPILIFVLPYTMQISGSHRVYIRGIYLVKTFLFAFSFVWLLRRKRYMGHLSGRTLG